MGVRGAICQRCGLPTGDDHAVPAASGPRPFQLGPEHAWLRREVVRPVIHGGSDAFHEVCSALEGPAGPAFRANGTYEWALVEGYHQQRFDFAALVADGKQWMLEEPKPGTRARARLERMRAFPEVGELTTVAAVVKADRDWVGRTVGDAAGRKALLRARRHTIEEVDRTGFETLVRITKFYEEPRLPGTEEMQELEAYERELKTAVEREERAVLRFAGIARGRAEYFVYARDGDATRAIAEAIPGTSSAKVETAPDPEWKIAREVLMRLRA